MTSQRNSISIFDELSFAHEHIHEALREYAGIANHTHAKKFPLGLKEPEKLQRLWG